MTRAPEKLALDPALDAWERQPKESLKRYNQFCDYRDMGRTRTLLKVAEKLALNARHVRQTAADFRWTDRVEAFDRHRDHLHEQQWLEERRKAAEDDAKILSAAIGKVVGRLANLKGEDLAVGDMIRLMDVVMRHRRLLYGDPTATVAVTGPGGDPVTVQLAEFAGMPTDQRRAAIADMLAAVARRTQAASGMSDDDE